jgi:hypothetical protein
MFHNASIFAKRLLAITDGCRDDMHEPDNQGVTAKVAGDYLDNAMGDDGICDEMFVAITKDHDHDRGDFHTENFNLATLIALARVGATKILDD